ncbi:splicing factor ESS-2 homolog isoform X2 [Rhipicephalus microplus]|uniref:splicing factor ESS-2 homolog isoform X2 n=1 Tax=Rhipicephalus microplus TaxID=6941 RepID=UPI003F6B3FDF
MPCCRSMSIMCEVSPKSKSSLDVEVSKPCKTLTVVRSASEPTKTRTVKVLDEDVYTTEIGKIIERDFFPDVPKLRAQNEYLDALEANNITKLRELQEKYQHRGSARSVLRSIQTPSTFETPSLEPSVTPAPSESGGAADNKSTSGLEPDSQGVSAHNSQLSLDAFLHKHTSEDNASFEVMATEAERRHREKHAWMYHDEKAEGAPLDAMLEGPAPKLALEGPSSTTEQEGASDRSKAPITWRYTNKNSLMYIPPGVALTEDEKRERGPGRTIMHCHTRLERSPFDESANKEALAQAANAQAKALEGKLGVDGRELQPGTGSPTVGGYGFVATPSPAPGVNETPLLTWGEIEGTPFLLDGSDTPLPRNPGGPQFRIPEPRSRERLAHSLADCAARRSAARKNAALDRARSSLLRFCILTAPRIWTVWELRLARCLCAGFPAFSAIHMSRHVCPPLLSAALGRAE